MYITLVFGGRFVSMVQLSMPWTWLAISCGVQFARGHWVSVCVCVCVCVCVVVRALGLTEDVDAQSCTYLQQFLSTLYMYFSPQTILMVSKFKIIYYITLVEQSDCTKWVSNVCYSMWESSIVTVLYAWVAKLLVRNADEFGSFSRASAMFVNVSALDTMDRRCRGLRTYRREQAMVWSQI